MGIHGLAAGPLAWDVELVNKALAPRRVLGGLGQVHLKYILNNPAYLY